MRICAESSSLDGFRLNPKGDARRNEKGSVISLRNQTQGRKSLGREKMGGSGRDTCTCPVKPHYLHSGKKEGIALRRVGTGASPRRKPSYCEGFRRLRATVLRDTMTEAQLCLRAGVNYLKAGKTSARRQTANFRSQWECLPGLSYREHHA